MPARALRSPCASTAAEYSSCSGSAARQTQSNPYEVSLAAHSRRDGGYEHAVVPALAVVVTGVRGGGNRAVTGSVWPLILASQEPLKRSGRRDDVGNGLGLPPAGGGGAGRARKQDAGRRGPEPPAAGSLPRR